MRKSFAFLMVASAFALSAEGVRADTAFDIGKHSQAAVGAACTKAGGTSWGIGLNGTDLRLQQEQLRRERRHLHGRLPYRHQRMLRQHAQPHGAAARQV